MVQNEVCAKYKETFLLIMIVCQTPLENFLGMRHCAIDAAMQVPECMSKGKCFNAYDFTIWKRICFIKN